MAGLDDLNAVLDEQFNALTPALNDVTAELARLSGLVGTGASEEQLAAAVAKANASTNRIREAVSGLVNHPETPQPETPVEQTPLPETPTDVIEEPEV